MITNSFPASLKKFAAALAGLALWVLAVPAFAQSGEFTYIFGGVTIERGGQQIMAVRGTKVQPLDVIVTAADSMAQLAMVDGAKLSLRSNSTLRLQQYAATREDQTNGLKTKT